jgi:hypothetical protein
MKKLRETFSMLGKTPKNEFQKKTQTRCKHEKLQLRVNQKSKGRKIGFSSSANTFSSQQ